MDFLKWIRNFSKKYKNREFQSEIKKEKQQKYLFRDSPTQIHTSRWGIFREKKRALKPFTNFFQEKIDKTVHVFFWDSRILGYLWLLLILLSSYILIFSSYFQISPSKVLIEAVNEWIDINISYRAIEDIYGKNLFFFDEESLALNLKKYQHNIETINIDRLYPNGLKIIITSAPIAYKATVSWREWKVWWLTSNGVLIPSSIEKLEAYRWFDIFLKIGEDELLDYKNIIPETKLLAISKVIEIFWEQWPDIKLGRARYLTDENEFHLALENGWKILFALQDFTITENKNDIYENLKNQVITLKAYLEKNRSIVESDGLIYIDVRVPGKIFVCRIKDICTKNLSNIYNNSY